MVADFCSLVILIHNTLVGDIMIRTTGVNGKNYSSILQYVMIHFHMQRFKFIDVMVIELSFFKKEKKKEGRRKKGEEKKKGEEEDG